jgi:hypothetical protein
MTKITGKRLALAVLLALLALVVPAMFAQETTAGLEGTVKDASGAVVPKATVEVTSPALIGAKKMETDNGGYFRFANLPPGTYTVTVTASGFRNFKQDNIQLQVGHLPNLYVTMEVGTLTETVEVSAQAALIDATQSKVQTNISDNELLNLPTQTRSFQSVIQFAPGARTEPLQAGYQINGASNSENSYLVEGLETASVFDGHSAANVPMDFIQEVQVKSTGFEAQYGGALGGVVNVIQKRGSNEWHGSLFTYYSGSAFDAAPNPTIQKDPSVPANANGQKRMDQPIQDYQPVQDHYRNITPGFTLGGYLVKDRLWVFGSTAPSLNPLSRTVNFAPSSGAAGKRTFNQNVNTYYSLARIDFMATQKIRLFGSWSYSYTRGAGTSLPNQDSAWGQYNSSSTTNPDNWNGGIGYVQPNVVYSTGADITLSPSIIATTRFGYFFQNYEDRGIPVGIRYRYVDTNYSYATGIPVLPTTTALDGTVAPSSIVNAAGWANIGANTSTAFDAWKRYNLSQDLAIFKRGFGTHNLKFGYSFNHGYNNVLTGYNTADVYVAFNQEYYPNTTNGVARCQSIIATNSSLYGKPGGPADGSSCQGLWGTVNIRDLGTTGQVGGWNHSLYAQDAWTVSRGLTINAGVRLDKENLPSYDQQTGFQGISFGWGQKIAPRLGVAYDVLQKGKVKLYGSFGYFYDIMKYQLPRGSFGGDYWHDCVYALDTPSFTSIIPQRDSQGHYCPTGGGAVPAVGSYPSGMRFIENYDYREPANDPNQIGSLGPTGLVDPNLAPMKQHEIAFGADVTLSPTLALEINYDRKRLDRTIEDAGTITQNGEVYYIVNPGMGVNSVTPNCNGCPPNPSAIRNYDGVELRLTKRFSSNWTGSFSYTYSRLYGNYTGLTATDVSDGGAGRNGANSDRAFDEPFMSFDASGHAINGPLPTDRPNTFKIYGYYNLKWWKFNTMIGGYEQIYSGTPLSTYISVWGAPVFVDGRGGYAQVTRDPSTGNFVLGNVSSQRTPMFSQADLSVSQDFHVSKTNERLVARIGADCLNCLNQHSPTYFDQNLVRNGSIQPMRCTVAGTNCTPTEVSQAGFDYGALMTKGYDWLAQANTSGLTFNNRYGMAYGFQNRRTMRFTLMFTF